MKPNEIEIHEVDDRPVRVLRVKGSAREVAAYLPTSYTVAWSDNRTTIVVGRDVADWTLDNYVIPRLASGLIPATELVVGVPT